MPAHIPSHLVPCPAVSQPEHWTPNPTSSSQPCFHFHQSRENADELCQVQSWRNHSSNLLSFSTQADGCLSETCPCHYSFWPIRFHRKFLAPILHELHAPIVVIVSFYIGVQLWLATQSLCLAMSSIFQMLLKLLPFFCRISSPRHEDSCNEGHQEDAHVHTPLLQLPSEPQRCPPMIQAFPCFPNGFIFRFGIVPVVFQHLHWVHEQHPNEFCLACGSHRSHR